ncbi:peroxiredoxin [Pelagibacteraceae bacterium]|jgi:peroxiredoxin|nr:peroxiredoxin [Pelagibacteraceae bacterium]|tara:strand:+ start:964 stop:1455 length:492 start_codon:yes stop_codon:yes gene_type:complete
MTIKVGDKIVNEPLMIPSKEKGVGSLNLQEFSKGKKIIVFAVPAAFSPTCSRTHLPGYLENYDKLMEKGIDAIICVSVNDIFVMKAWAKDQNSGDKVILAADGSAKFTKAIGMDVDLDTFGQGIRSKRYSMLIDDSIIKSINIEGKPGQAEDSGATKMLEIIG